MEKFNTIRDVARELARKYSTMTHSELDILESILVPRKYLKGQMILSEGEVCKDLLYVAKGMTRQFYFKNGKELTEHMSVEGGIVMCIESLFKEEPTRLQIEALEPTWVFAMPKARLEGWRCTMSTYRYSTARYWKRVSLYRRCMPTSYASRPRKTGTRRCARSCRR